MYIATVAVYLGAFLHSYDVPECLAMRRHTRRVLSSSDGVDSLVLLSDLTTL